MSREVAVRVFSHQGQDGRLVFLEMSREEFMNYLLAYSAKYRATAGRP